MVCITRFHDIAQALHLRDIEEVDHHPVLHIVLPDIGSDTHQEGFPLRHRHFLLQQIPGLDHFLDIIDQVQIGHLGGYIHDRPAGVGGDQVDLAGGGRGEFADDQFPVDHDLADPRIAEIIVQIVIQLQQLLYFKLVFRIQSDQLLVQRLELLVGALQLFIGGEQLFVCRLELFIGGLKVFDGHLELASGFVEL